MGGRPARTQASQGEQRSVVVAMRLAAYRLLDARLGEPPVLLLDDVFSELDLLRTAAVVDLLPRGQVLVTTTRHDEVPGDAKRWEVSGGTVTCLRSLPSGGGVAAAPPEAGSGRRGRGSQGGDEEAHDDG